VVLGSCETADDLLRKVHGHTPDVAIVDIRLPPTDSDEGMRAALEIRARHPSAAGGSALDPTIISTLLSRQRSDDPLDELTPREREVLELMAEGRSNQGIADALAITLRAVEKYVSSVFTKLGLPSTGSESRRVLAVLLYLRS
jgi:DNA-binding NarL/FixJ family response regulator